LSASGFDAKRSVTISRRLAGFSTSRLIATQASAAGLKFYRRHVSTYTLTGSALGAGGGAAIGSTMGETKKGAAAGALGGYIAHEHGESDR
jgi:hypothetical protein